MDPFPREILELIAAHDGQYGWYQLDRALATWSANRERNLPLLRSLPERLRGLETDGLIVSGTGHHPAQPIDTITAKGRQAIGSPVAMPSSSTDRWAAVGQAHPRGESEVV